MTLSEYGLELDPEQEPRQLRVFGGDLGESVWAVWLSPAEAPAARAPVIVSIEHNADALVIASSGIAEFLKFETAAGILFEPGESAEEALDALQLPRHLRRQPTPYDELAEWADPTLGARNHWQDRAQLHLTSITEVVQSLIASCASDL